jgi:hypothetical protein
MMVGDDFQLDLVPSPGSYLFLCKNAAEHSKALRLRARHGAHNSRYAASGKAARLLERPGLTSGRYDFTL